MGEQSINDECVESDDDGWATNNDDAQQRDGHALFLGEGVVEGIILQREMLVEGWDLINDGEDANEDPKIGVGQLGSLREEVVCLWRGLHYDEVVDDIPAFVSPSPT